MEKTIEKSNTPTSTKAFPAKYGARWLEPSMSTVDKKSPESLKSYQRGLSTDGLPYRQPRIDPSFPTPSWTKSLSAKHKNISKNDADNKGNITNSAENLFVGNTLNRKSQVAGVQEYEKHGTPHRFISVPEGKVSASRELFDRGYTKNHKQSNGSWQDHQYRENNALVKEPKSARAPQKSLLLSKDSNASHPATSNLELHHELGSSYTRPGSENSFFTSVKHDKPKKKFEPKNASKSSQKFPNTIPANMSTTTFSSIASNESGLVMKSSNNLDQGKCAALKCWSSEKETTRHFFAHYDWQSMTFNFEDAKLAIDTLKRKNITTGASKAAAAKLQSRENSPSASMENLVFEGTESNGAEKRSNDMLLWCPFFVNEIGGDPDDTNIEINEGGKAVSVQWVRSENTSHSVTNSPTQAHMLLANHKGLSVMEKSGIDDSKMLNTVGFIMEHVDKGALYYKTHFVNQEHQNFFGIDDEYGPIAISLKRERVKEVNQNNKDNVWQYRVILRTSEMCTLRGSILEDVLMSQNHPATRGLRPRDVLEYVCPEIDIDCLKVAQMTDTVQQQLSKVDEQNVSNTYKIGVMYCRKGQSTEEDMYNNVHGSPALEEFLDLMGTRIQLKGFSQFRGGLDVKTNSTGKESYFTTFQGNEIMFHVSTLLPHSKNNRQQLLRKRHVGNDIVTIVFQEPDSLPFSPEHIRSHFQHLFLVVRVYQPCSPNTCYRIAQTRYQDIPSSTPLIPKQALFPKSETFKEFLLTKIINGENAARNAGKFKAMSMNTRQEYLRDLAVNHCTVNPVDNSGTKFSKFSLSVAARRREKGKGKLSPEVVCTGALVWQVVLKDCGPKEIPCMLGISDYVLGLVQKSTKRLIFSIPCHAIIGWSEYSSNLLHIYYGRGERLSIAAASCAACSWKNEVISRLKEFSIGETAVSQNLRRNSKCQLGFHINYEGIVMDVEPRSPGWQQGRLTQGCRLVEICKVLVVTMSHEEMLDLLRTSDVVNVIMIPPYEDGAPRRCSKSLYHINPVVKVIEFGSRSKLLDDNTIHLRSKSDPAHKSKKSYQMSSEDLNINNSNRSLRNSSSRSSGNFGSGTIQSDSEYITTKNRVNFTHQISSTPSMHPIPIPRAPKKQPLHDVNARKIACSLNTNMSNNETNNFTVPQKRNRDKSRSITNNLKHSTSTESGLNVIGIHSNQGSRRDLNLYPHSRKSNSRRNNELISSKLQNFVFEKHKLSNGRLNKEQINHKPDTSRTSNHRKVTYQRQVSHRTRTKLTRAMSDESICGIVQNPKPRKRNPKHSRHGTYDVPLVDEVNNWDQLVNIASTVEDHSYPELKQNYHQDLSNGLQVASDYYSENDLSDKAVTPLSSRSISPVIVADDFESFDPMEKFSNADQTSEAEERLRQIEITLKTIQSQLSQEKKSKQMILKEVEKLRKENTRLQQNQSLMKNNVKGPTYF